MSQRSRDSGNGPLSADEENGLIRRAQAGDADAWRRLVEAHQGAIRRLARRYQLTACQIGDLEQAGNEGLFKAIECFDPNRNNRLWTYAKFWVAERIIRECAKRLGLRDEARKWYARMHAAHRELWAKRGQEPTAAEIMEFLDARSEQRVSEVERARGQPLTPPKIARQRPRLEIVEELLRAWEGREIPLADDDEHEEDALSHSVDASELIDLLSETERPGENVVGRMIVDVLGEKGGRRWLALCALQESGYTWEEIAATLSADPPPVPVPWPDIVDSLALHRLLSRAWPEVCALFQPPPPHLTPDGLKQWYHRQRRVLQRSLPF
jgi:RNA polymerase sigma factor (sigma-70 family)